MPELIRVIVGRFRELVGNRRRAARYKVRVPVSVFLIDAKTTSTSHKLSATLDGYTRDIGATGLALVMPAIRIGEYYLTDQAHELEIRLEPSVGQTLLVRAAAVRYEQLDAEAGERGYLIGVRVIEVDDPQRFAAYLKTLATGKRE